MFSFSNATLRSLLVKALVLGFVAVPAFRVYAQSAQSPNGLTGAWWVAVTLYDCNTGVKRPPFSSILLFERGGTLAEATRNPGFQPGQRSTGFGTWSQSQNSTYQASDWAFIQFTAVPFQAGTQKIQHTIALNNDGSAFTDDASVFFYDTTGSLIQQGCATATGTRLQ
jgi:hypothetical protein